MSGGTDISASPPASVAPEATKQTEESKAVAEADTLGDWGQWVKQQLVTVRQWRDQQLVKWGATNVAALKEYAMFAVYMVFVVLIKAVTIAMLWNAAGRSVLKGENISIRSALAVVLIWLML